MFVMVVGQFPFTEASSSDPLYELISSNDEKKHEKFWNLSNNLSISPQFKDLFMRMVHVDASKRPTIDQLLADEWIDVDYDELK